MPGIASAATSVVIGHVAAGTSTIRVGAGGVMLPNHSPLVIAEQFGTLELLHPGRIDLAVGRAPGTDQRTAFALRRDAPTAAERFPQDVVELLHYFQPVQANQPVRAYPGAGLQVPVWILGSSLFGAQLAAMLGLPFAFASHFAPEMLLDALKIYRSSFRKTGFHRAADCHGGYWRLRGRHGARGPPPLLVGAAAIREPAPRAAHTVAAARRKHGWTLERDRARGSSKARCVMR